MSVITFPDALAAKKLSWGQRRNDMESRSVFGAQAVEVGHPLWEVSMDAPLLLESGYGAWKALIMQLRGKTNQLALWDIGRPAPRGTLRGTMTLHVAAAQGATSLQISNGGVGTLLAGDLLGLGSSLTQQVVMVMAAATANGSGVITVTTEPALRNAFAGGAAVTWDKPKALFRQSSSGAGWSYEENVASGITLSLIEDWRP